MNTPLRIALSLAVAGVLLFALMAWGGVDFAEVWGGLRALSPADYALVLGIHGTIYALRALRFRILIPPEFRPSYGRALIVSAAHNLAAYVLPAKTGEASFVLYLKRMAGVTGARGLASLLVSRLLDLAVLCSGLSLACLFVAFGVSGPQSEVAGGLVPVAILLFAATIVFCFVGARGHVLVTLFERIAKLLRCDKLAIGRRALALCGDVEHALRGAGGEGRLFFAALISLPLWLLVFGFYAVLARHLGLPDTIGFAEAAFGSGMAVMCNLLPINGLAGFGTQEAGWTFGFELMGVGREIALATGIGAHLVQLFNVCLFGVIGHLFMGALGSHRANDDTD